MSHETNKVERDAEEIRSFLKSHKIYIREKYCVRFNYPVRYLINLFYTKVEQTYNVTLAVNATLSECSHVNPAEIKNLMKYTAHLIDDSIKHRDEILKIDKFIDKDIEYGHMFDVIGRIQMNFRRKKELQNLIDDNSKLAIMSLFEITPST